MQLVLPAANQQERATNSKLARGDSWVIHTLSSQLAAAKTYDP